MGGCFGAPLTEEQKAAAKANALIEKSVKKDATKEQRKIKLLLLGTGESGKSTILKQLKKLHGDPMTEEEIAEWVPRVYENINKQIKSLILGAEIIGEPLNDGLTEYFKSDDYKVNTMITEKLADQIKAFWNDPQTQAVWEKRAKYQIIDSIEYYVQHIDRIAKSDYMPDFQDIIQARVRTSGIVTERFKMENSQFELYDVGGQRNERKKWINCFDNVTSVIFVTAISEYDQKLFEDSQTDRIEESLDVFEQTVNNLVFKDIAFIIFLNKFDLFQEKIFQHPYRVLEGDDARNMDFEGPYAEDIKDEHDEKAKAEAVEAAAFHTQKKFQGRADGRSGMGALSYHHTNATDADNMDKIFEQCKNQILRINLGSSGLAIGP